MRCINCECENHQTKLLCADCLQGLAVLIAPEAYCGICRRPLPPNSSECQFCSEAPRSISSDSKIQMLGTIKPQKSSRNGPEWREELIKTRRFHLFIKSLFLTFISILIFLIVWMAKIWIQTPYNPYGR